VIILIATDETTSSRHFVKKLRRRLADSVQGGLQFEDDEYPSDELEGIVSAAHAAGIYPVVIIERFHAFAQVADEHLLSVLSALRALEHSSQVTTLAITPVSYDVIRRQLAVKGAFPFVNSAYGDNHERAILTPISRSDFVNAAVSRGLASDFANRIFSLAGGPDSIHGSLIDAATSSEERLTDRCVDLVGDRLDGFFRDAFFDLGAAGDDLFGKLALGQLLPHEEDHVETHLLSKFLAKRGRSGRLITASPILSRLFLRRRKGVFAIYDEILEAIRSGNYQGAVALASSTESPSNHLQLFKSVVELLAALHANDDRNLLNIAWPRIVQPAQNILSRNEVPKYILSWATRMLGWARIVAKHGVPMNESGPRLDALTARADDKATYELTLFSMLLYLSEIKKVLSPGMRVRSAASIPESILQMLSVAFCNLDFRCSPAKFPLFNYQIFFDGKGEFILPSPGKKMDLTDLLVIVPTILSNQLSGFTPSLSIFKPEYVVPLHQKITARVRNASAHTYMDVSDKDAKFFVDTCSDWLEAAVILNGFASSVDFLSSVGTPDVDELSSFLFSVEEQ
jgi:hypothetical protein